MSEQASAAIDDAGPPRISLGVRAAAVAIGLSARTVEGMAQRGELPSFKVGRRRLFAVRALEEWAARQSAAAQEHSHGRAAAAGVRH